MTEPKKGLSPLAWIGIGCGGLLLIGILVVSVGGYFAAKTVSDFVGDNPAAAAAEAIVRINPELELVESDREAGTITIREKSTGKEVTVNYSQLERGELVFGDGEGEEVRVQSGTSGDGGPISITGSDGSSVSSSSSNGTENSVDSPTRRPLIASSIGSSNPLSPRTKTASLTGGSAAPPSSSTL